MSSPTFGFRPGAAIDVAGVALDDGAAGNLSNSLYGWQGFGAYNVFSDGPAADPSCAPWGPIGTLSPTTIAFQLFNYVVGNGEKRSTRL